MKKLNTYISSACLFLNIVLIFSIDLWGFSTKTVVGMVSAISVIGILSGFLKTTEGVQAKTLSNKLLLGVHILVLAGCIFLFWLGAAFSD